MRLRYQFRSLFPALTAMVVLLGGLFCCWSGSSAKTAEVAITSLPFRPGESQVYELRWGIIPAGFAELAVLPMAELGGVQSWHFRLSVRTNEFVDIFYKVRDKIEAFADLSLRESLRYRKTQREGRSVRDEEIRFDIDKGLATYSNKGEVFPAIKLMAGTIDPLTAVFFVRSQPLRTGLEIVRPITDGKKNVVGMARVLSRENIEINGVQIDCFRVEPDLRDVAGVFEKSDKSRISLWFTADERHLLVKVEGKVVVGSFTGTLIDQPGATMLPMD